MIIHEQYIFLQWLWHKTIYLGPRKWTEATWVLWQYNFNKKAPINMINNFQNFRSLVATHIVHVESHWLTVQPVLRDHCLERPPVLRDHLSWKTRYSWQNVPQFNVIEPVNSWQNVPQFNVIEPVTKDHLFWDTKFLWPIGWSTVFRDHLSWKTRYALQNVLHFNVIEPVTKDHLFWHTKFLWPVELSFKTGFTVYDNADVQGI